MAVRPEALYSCLLDDLMVQGLPCGDTWPGMTVRQAAASSIARSFLKKFEVANTSKLDAVALDKFLACNDACEKWSLPVDYDCKTEILLGQVKSVLYGFWHRRGPIMGEYPPPPRGRLPPIADYALVDHHFDILAEARVGPGVTQGAHGESFYSKLFSSPLTASSSSLYFWYRRYVTSFPEWANAENIRYANYGQTAIAVSSKLSFVPKNDKTSRTICIEPSLNTYFQLGFGRILERRLAERFGISLATQPFKNRHLARLGSQKDELSTLDLSSASDSISLRMLRYLLPPSFMRWLELLRCPTVDIKGRGCLPLNMVSTMGNGFTFPLQTVLFASIVVACLQFAGISERSTDDENLWGVFGDDIICPRSVTSNVKHLLALLGFTVNHDKSYDNGPFKESCGADFYQGVDIRGVYIKRVDTLGSRYSALNQLLRFSSRTGIDFPRTASLLLHSLGKEPLFIPRWEDMSGGLHVPFSELPLKVVDKDCQAYAYTILIPHPRRYIIGDGYIMSPKGRKQLIYNSSGLFISFVQGSVNSSAIGVREDFTRTRTKRRVTSSWDDTSYPLWESRDYQMDWRRWNSVVRHHLERG